MIGSPPVGLAPTASVMSPSKLLSAGASIDKPEAVGGIMGYAFRAALLSTAVRAVMTQLWAF